MLSGGITVFIYASVQVGGFSSSIKALDDAGLNNFFEYVLKFHLNYFSFYTVNLISLIFITVSI